MPEPRTVTAYGWLLRHSVERPDRLAVAAWPRESPPAQLTFSRLHDRVERVAAGLLEGGAADGRVVLCLPNGADFTSALVACLAAGVVAVPAPVPNITRRHAFAERLSSIVQDCRPALVVTTGALIATVEEVLRAHGEPCPIADVESLVGTSPGRGLRAEAAADGLAYLQYTSGSTTRPKGVVVTHGMLHSTCEQAASAYQEGPDDTAVSWVPMYHDMGLITAVARPLYTGYTSVLLRPEDFVRQPSQWLSAISTCHGTLSSAPNFAYELCVRKIPAAEAGRYDLSRWRVARNAGEVVRADTADRFARHFTASGFRAAAMAPSYGLAEATLVVTTCGPSVAAARLSVDAGELRGGVLAVARPGEPATTLLSSGRPVDGTQVRIEAPHGRVGAVHVLGPQITPGYWPLRGTGGASAHPSEWLDTGDVGAMVDGHLYVLGRGDDTLVVNGRNYFLSDITVRCAAVPGIRPGRVAAFLDADPLSPARVHLVGEAAEPFPDESALTALRGQIRAGLMRDLDLPVATVDFVSRGTLPVTTSGKVQVSRVRADFHAGRLSLLTTGSHPARHG